jgi:NADH-quinone oxidoreductase subunit M
MEIILIPIIASLVTAGLGKRNQVWISVLLSLIPLALLYTYFTRFGVDQGWKSIFDLPWISEKIRFTLGFDGLTGILLLLTNLMVPVIVMSAIRNDENQVKLTALTLFMQGALNGVFMAQDGLMFYIFWELALIPIYFITLTMTGENAFKITLRFFLYTFIGSLAMLASLLYLFLHTANYSFSFEALRSVELSLTESIWVGAGILLAFAVKIPLLPFHSWQADTYTHSPAAGSMLLSGIMLKMGLYGLLRWYLPLAPESIEFFQPWIMGLSVAGILYGALIAMRQKDMKRLVAFSSLSHVALITAGIFTLTLEGLEGGVLQMFVHGVNVIGLFLVIELIERSSGTRILGELGGLAKSNRSFMIFFMLLALGTVAVPLTNGFPGEFMLLKGVYHYSPKLTLIAGLTIVFCAVYIFRMVQISMFGEGKFEVLSLKWNEYLAFGILSAAVLFLGCMPQPLIDIIHSSIVQIVNWVSEAKGVLS